MSFNVVDRPAEAAEDKLGMDAYAAALTEFIRDAQAPLTIALQGEWGSGKTSLMNALKQKLVDDKDAPYLGVWINTWQYALMSDPGEAIAKILLGIIAQISSDAGAPAEERKRFFGKFLTFAGSAASQFVAKQFGVDFKKNIEEWNGESAAPERSGVEQLKAELGAWVEKSVAGSNGKKGYLFFIDDLDRIDPPVAVQILELLKNVFDLEKCIFVLAIDYGVVVKGLKPKFGAMTAENEREFRSFFDKIIQLPFSMPVANYKIDAFLTDSLADIGYLDGKEKNDKTLCEAFTAYALDSVGTNPRSLKRLINYLSLIRLLIRKTDTKEDDADFASWKDVLFALVSLQIQYPKVYDALLAEPDFPNWGESFEQAMQLPALKEGEAEKLAKMTEFDERWEQMLFRFCRLNAFLEARAPNISRILNRIKTRIEVEQQPVGETVDWLMSLSAVTSVKSEQAQTAMPDFNVGWMLKELRQYTLGLERISGTKGWETMLANRVYLSTWQGRVQSGLSTELWIDKRTHNDETDDGFLTEPQFRIFHDGRSFQLKIFGEVWGNWPQEKYKGIDFGSNPNGIAEVEAAYCDAWKPFGIKGKLGLNVGHSEGNDIGADDMWWNITIPFKDHEELVSDAFSQKLRSSLAAVAAAFSSLTKYRIPVNT